MYVPIDSLPLRLVFRTFLLIVFCLVVIRWDLPTQSIPLLNRLAKKRK